MKKLIAGLLTRWAVVLLACGAVPCCQAMSVDYSSGSSSGDYSSGSSSGEFSSGSSGVPFDRKKLQDSLDKACSVLSEKEKEILVKKATETLNKKVKYCSKDLKGFLLDFVEVFDRKSPEELKDLPKDFNWRIACDIAGIDFEKFDDDVYREVYDCSIHDELPENIEKQMEIYLSYERDKLLEKALLKQYTNKTGKKNRKGHEMTEPDVGKIDEVMIIIKESLSK